MRRIQAWLAVALQCGAALAVLWVTRLAYGIWVCVLSGRLYDESLDATTVHSLAYPLTVAGIAVLLALLSLLVKGSRISVLIIIVWAVLALVMIPIGLHNVRFMIEG
jgi:hypothetical protein